MEQTTCNERGRAPVAADRIIDNPIINSPSKVPDRHFKFDYEGITSGIVPGRRPSQYFVPGPRPREKGQQLDLAEFTADKIRLNDFVHQSPGPGADAAALLGACASGGPMIVRGTRRERKCFLAFQ